MEQTTVSVLLIDDDSIFTDVISNHLQREGMHCLYAPQGAVALDMLSKGPLPNIILLDIVMPDMSGFEVLSKLKVDPKTAGIPVIMFSNEFTPENQIRAQDLGAAKFLEKVQATPGDVARAIQELLVSAKSVGSVA